ncbi:hypothetical protein H2198_001663 [Neophaeococcomyces mojaviensis]|uniref:Uncharacterized protein n=1 Tax=Neophaeococcomyces mojaviensis TaxID=3383035 RepID=A0ACC3AGG9_9EURO|nr:hypothetical protein H2198_001663 [Knufia sp. JES_112]
MSPNLGVTIFDEPEHIEPPTSYDDDDTRSPTLVAQSPKLHRASVSGRKMTGRPALHQSPSNASLTQTMSNLKLDNLGSNNNQTPDGTGDQALLHQVMQWLQDERGKRSDERENAPQSEPGVQTKRSDSSVKSDRELSLDKLERILAKYAVSSLSSTSALQHRQSSNISRRGSVARKLLRSPFISAMTSDTDAGDAVAVVPHVEASLDNTKTLSYSGGAAVDSADTDSSKPKDQKYWEVFKQDILRLTHTLGLRGWRRLPLEHGGTLHVERLSGALTNAVYVVKPPKDMSLFQKKIKAADGTEIPMRRSPKELLLRVYGPQVEHLIDRDNELMILRRLAVRNIGPKLLGYFTNGRFEEFLHAKTLTPQDLRDGSTSKQIAKRMKELHEGIDLLESEKAGGPFVFKNWDAWVDRVEKVITWLDQQVHDEEHGKPPSSKRYTRRGLVCGVEWKFFRDAYDSYRARLVKECGGKSGIRRRLVFAHNDTQYGNLMKLQPGDESPLLQPVNQHKQLVVIDFEYANANTRGLEFVNHFTEWCYDYHHPEHNYACNTKQYPTPDEQKRFLRAYVMHRPQFAPSASSTPLFEGREKTNIPNFMLDARAPGSGYASDYDTDERAWEKAQEQEIQDLLQETRLWRIANSAQWVAWGIVQAKVPELDELPKKSVAGAVVDKVLKSIHVKSDPLDEDVKDKQEAAAADRPEGREQEEAHHEGADDEDEDAFDYLAYAQERAMFFWGDCVLMGIVKESDLPEAMRPHIKYVKY